MGNVGEIDRKANFAFLTELLRAAIDAADPTSGIMKALPEKPRGRVIVVGAGKASAQMAKAFEDVWPDPVEGAVVTRYGHGVPTRFVEVLEASHPVPDEAGLLASRRMMNLVGGLTRDDLVVAMISGGGSALLPAPFDGLTLDDEQAVNRALLSSGMPIDKMNKVRNELSAIKGGRLAKLAYPARVHTYVLSDVAGDEPALVASGPTIPIGSSREEVRHLIELYRLPLPESVMSFLASELNPPPRVDDPIFARNQVHLVASAGLSLKAAAEAAERLGMPTHILSDSIEGESRDVALVLAAIAREVKARDQPFTAPTLLLSGGETTVTLRSKGRGGRNSEFALAFAIAVDGLDGICAIAADTDGIDGSENNAGALMDGTSATRMRKAGVDPHSTLANNDAWTAFSAIGDLVVTGPTGTNVNDFRAILIT